MCVAGSNQESSWEGMNWPQLHGTREDPFFLILTEMLVKPVVALVDAFLFSHVLTREVHSFRV